MRLASSVAYVAHEGQVRKGSGEPYFMHPIRVEVAVSNRGWKARCIALLHDTVEDTPVTLDALRAIGFPDHIVRDIDALTRREGEVYADFVQRTCRDGSQDALHVKLADIFDNLNDPGWEIPSGMVRRYRKAQVLIEDEIDRRTAA